MLSLPMRIQALGIDVVAAHALREGLRQINADAPGRRPSAAPDFRKSRRAGFLRIVVMVRLPSCRRLCGSPRGCAGRCRSGRCCRHGGVDVRVGRLGLRREQRGRAHDLARLAVAALRHVERDPGVLHLLADGAGAYALDRRDLLADGRRDRRAAGANRLAVQMHRARAAQLRAAAELGAGHAERVAQDPEQRRVRIGVDLTGLAVDGDAGHRVSPPRW